MLSCVHSLPYNAKEFTLGTLILDRRQQRHTPQQQPSTTAATEAAEPASSQMAEAPAAKLWHRIAAQTVNVPSREEGERGLRSHLQAFQIGCHADHTLSGICSQVRCGSVATWYCDDQLKPYFRTTRFMSHLQTHSNSQQWVLYGFHASMVGRRMLRTALLAIRQLLWQVPCSRI